MILKHFNKFVTNNSMISKGSYVIDKPRNSSQEVILCSRGHEGWNKLMALLDGPIASSTSRWHIYSLNPSLAHLVVAKRRIAPTRCASTGGCSIPSSSKRRSRWYAANSSSLSFGATTSPRANPLFAIMVWGM